MMITWRWDRHEMIGRATVRNDSVRAVVSRFTRHGDVWGHVRVYVPSMSGLWDEKHLIHSAMERCMRDEKREAERAMRLVVRLHASSGLDDLSAAIYRGEPPPLSWAVAHARPGVDPVTHLWRSSVDACGLVRLAQYLELPTRRPDDRFQSGRIPASRQLSGICCESIVVGGQERRVELSPSRRMATFVRDMATVEPTFEMAAEASKRYRAGRLAAGMSV